ncbi:ABC transporter ATP-binding protein [Nitratireductor aestuarii]|uniref:ABC transporter ATP-binding protein n=1 Tax=Nitratireductor aestuarii TaxID=1735103 RepID=A0A916S2H7_9HYPH|nr:ABC transporter ATP-binding protein [Nitratireductor aestuarii]GGA78900.1 ABC transporter ATP-binding protein [Nitratireductor aestuarii]
MVDALTLQEITAGYQGSVVLRSVSLSVPVGQNVAIVGPNGAGKSTLLKAISGLVSVKEGSIRINGNDTTNWPPEKIVSAGVVHVPEGRQVFPGLSVEENLWLGGYTKPSRREDLLADVLDLFPRLKERLRQAADSLSGGEQQMLAIGRGLMAEPQVLMLDEPTLGLAPVIVDLMIDALENLRSRKELSLLVVEQSVQLTRGLCEHAYILVDGKIAASGATDEVINDDMMKIYLGTH